jgi:3-deoxy-D-manno-octulosonate 8-phosphate phosphatase (KDO 8-P phosphatase)
MVILDVDGVLTDGRVIYDANGLEYRCFDVHDGYGISRARELGVKLALLSGRTSKVVNHRARRLRITEVHQGAGDKVSVFKEIKKKYQLKDEEFCFIGDDEFDLPLLDLVGFSAAPHNAIERVRQRVDYVAEKDGGRGAVREVLDMILRARKLI